MFRLSSVYISILGRAVLVLYFILAFAILVLRYWVLPNIDTWRPEIAEQLSAASGSEVTLGELRAQWTGLNPTIELSNVVLTGEGTHQERLLVIPHVRAQLSWRSIFLMAPQLISLQASGVKIDVRRDAQRRISIMGLELGTELASDPNTDFSRRLGAWLTTQPRIVLDGTTIRWTDEWRMAKPLILEDVRLEIANKGSGHGLSLRARLSPELGESLEVRSKFQTAGSDGAAFDWSQLSGRLYVRLGGVKPAQWAPWTDTTQGLQSGTVSAQAWLDVENARAKRLISDIRVANASVNMFNDTAVRAELLEMYMDGPWESYQGVLPSTLIDDLKENLPQHTEPLSYHVVARGLHLHAESLFDYPLDFQHIDAQGAMQNMHDINRQVRADRLHVVNKDMDALLRADWQQGGAGPWGLLDLAGEFKRAKITAIDDYLPIVINLEAREWMRTGLLAGEIADASIIVKGDLQHFPFKQEGPEGEFRIDGIYTGGVIDYLPAEGNLPAWPKLTDMNGSVHIHGADLRVVAKQAIMSPASGMAIQVNDVLAHIPDIEHDSVLSITGQTEADAQAYLALMTHSPLGAMLDGVFNHSSAQGKWRVPLSLTIPLLNTRQTRVDGSIEFLGGALRISPEMPAMSDVTGTLDFTNTAVSTSKLNGKFLGGDLAIQGGVGDDLRGLQLQGRLGSVALADFLQLDGMKRIQGSTAYRATLQRDAAKNLTLVVHSDLKGLALDLPQPLSKVADKALPLRVDWRPSQDKKGRVLNIVLGTDIEARLLHREGRAASPYFHTGWVGVNQQPKLLAQGMNLDVRYPSVDVNMWDRVFTEFSTTSRAKSGSKPGRSVLPPLAEVRLQAERARVYGVDLDELTFTMRQPTPAHWRLDVSSSQTAGTLFWREAKGRVAGRIDAIFDRLALGDKTRPDDNDEPPTSDETLDVADELDIPRVNLQVRNFRLYGRDMGELSLVGTNQARGHLWRIDELQLKSPSASLTGSGLWRLSGRNRGLTLDAKADISDLGAYLDQIDFKDLMKAGKGTVEGQVEWRNMPWGYSKSDLNGALEFKLENGRFNNVNSRSARLLELLSLQSVQRLARLDFNPGGLTKEGFPYDNLRGHVFMEDGIMRTDDYRVIGPVGTIVIGGEVNLIDEKLNLQAVVIPNLDISGAAVAAGIAINPILGVGAFLTQWLLQAPLAKAMTAEYGISGDWSNPTITELNPPPKAAGSNQ